MTFNPKIAPIGIAMCANHFALTFDARVTLLFKFFG